MKKHLQESSNTQEFLKNSCNPNYLEKVVDVDLYKQIMLRYNTEQKVLQNIFKKQNKMYFKKITTFTRERDFKCDQNY